VLINGATGGVGNYAIQIAKALGVAVIASARPGGEEDHVRALGADEVVDWSDGDVVDFMLQINAGAYSFEVGNPRHQHEWRIWETKRLPEGKVLMPGFLCHAHNFVEHPQLIADSIVTYAELVGRENVIASADCGFSSRAIYTPEVHPTVVWAKFEALAEGARLATERLW